MYVPEGDGPFAAVAMAHGFSATIGMGVTAWAERLSEAGFAALAYDHRHLGASEGEPRQLVDWALQARDLGHALTFLAERPEVDAERLATWGSSFSGGQGAYVAADDDRVRAVIANVPFLGNPATADEDVPAPSDPVQMLVIPEDGIDLPAMMAQEEAVEWFRSAATPDWQNRVLLAPIPNPAPALARLRVPMLAILATEDRVAPVAMARAAMKLVLDGWLVELPGHHFVPYSGEPFDRAATAAVDFLQDVL